MVLANSRFPVNPMTGHEQTEWLFGKEGILLACLQHADAEEGESSSAKRVYCRICAEYRRGLEALMSGLRPSCTLLVCGIGTGPIPRNKSFSVDGWERQGNWLAAVSPLRPLQEGAGRGPDNLLTATLPTR